MLEILEQLRRWAEVWPLLIPLFIFFIYGVKDKSNKPIIIFVIASFFVSLIAIVFTQFYTRMPTWFKSNGILYNINSILRTILFGWYILQIAQVKRFIFTRILLMLYIGTTILFILLSKSIWSLDVPIFASESIVLLILCLTYFLNSIMDDDVTLSFKDPVFLVCAGLSFYEGMNFFFYLFIYALSDSNHNLGYITMKISQYSFIALCILLGIALYLSRPRKNQPLKNSLEIN
jgi:hypothetical protein